MEKLYDRIDWVDYKSPAIDASNLNSMSKAIDDIDDRVIVVANSIGSGGGGGSAVWGAITGTLSDQTDLKKALDAKSDSVTVTQTLTTGTEVGTIKVGDTSTTLYAPNGGSGSASWGDITGTLSDQEDLQTALDAKADEATTLSGYGITDAYTKTEVDTALSGKSDTVTVTQSLTSGTEIASVKVGDTTTMLYAPGGSGGSVSWGGITGTLSNQTDLQTALDDKASASELSDIQTDIALAKAGAYIPDNLMINGIENGSFSSTGEDQTGTARARTVGYIDVKPSTKYTLTFSLTDSSYTPKVIIYCFTSKGTQYTSSTSALTGTSITYTTGSTVNYIRIIFYILEVSANPEKYIKNPMFESYPHIPSNSELNTAISKKSDAVTVIQTLTQGTEIGTVNVGSKSTTLYAPATSSATWGSITGTLSDQEDLNTELTSIKSDNNKFASDLSDAYSASTTYAVGDIVIYDNYLWKCLAECSGQTPTEGTYWTQTNISKVIDDSTNVEEISSDSTYRYLKCGKRRTLIINGMAGQTWITKTFASDAPSVTSGALVYYTPVSGTAFYFARIVVKSDGSTAGTIVSSPSQSSAMASGSTGKIYGTLEWYVE